MEEIFGLFENTEISSTGAVVLLTILIVLYFSYKVIIKILEDKHKE